MTRSRGRDLLVIVASAGGVPVLQKLLAELSLLQDAGVVRGVILVANYADG